MRVLVILLVAFVAISLDTISKFYFDDFAWQKNCYLDSPYSTSTVIADTTQSLRPIGLCTRDIRSGGDYYGAVYKDNYIPLLGEYLGFKLSYNRGVAFSLPLHGLPLQILTIILVFWILYYYIRIEYTKSSILLDLGYALILSGAISHGYERIVNGYVVDFISIKYFAILNFADIFISIGFGLIVLSYFLYDGKRNR